MLIDWMCYRIVMAWPLPLPDCRDSRAFAWCLARAGAYADPTPNVELTRPAAFGRSGEPKANEG